MFRAVAEDIVLILIKNEIVEDENRDIYAYGLEALLLNSLNIITALLISIFSGTIAHFIVFIMIFVPTRMFVGGYHAKTSESCYMKTTIIYAFTVLSVKLLPELYTNIFAIISLIILASLMMIFAPVENKNNPLSTSEKKRNKKISIVLTVIDSLIFITFYYMTLPIATSVMILMAVNSILMIIGVLEKLIKGDGPTHL